MLQFFDNHRDTNILLSIITSKIQNFINSQRANIAVGAKIVVYNHVKDTKFHQFTTAKIDGTAEDTLSIITSKIQNFINSQLTFNSKLYENVVYNHVKDTKFHQFTTIVKQFA